MKAGYDIFGKAFGISLRNDPHAAESIDHKFMKEMILLDKESFEFLYNKAPDLPDMTKHELYVFAQQFMSEDDKDTICNTLKFCSSIARNYDVPIEQMLFGGTEKEIIERGTDWCADMARVGVVLLMCNGIPARMVTLVNPQRAYNGHVVVEAFYEGKYGVCDYIYGYCFHDGKPLDAYELQTKRELLSGYPDDYIGMYDAVAINEYDPTAGNCYAISKANQYTLNVINTDHNDKWFMGEDADETVSCE